MASGTRRTPSGSISTRTYAFTIPVGNNGAEFPPSGTAVRTQEVAPVAEEDRLTTVNVVLATSIGQYMRVPASLSSPMPYAILSYNDQDIGAQIATGNSAGRGFKQAQIVTPDVPYYTIIPAGYSLFANIRGPIIVGVGFTITQVLVSLTVYPAILGDTTALLLDRLRSDGRPR